MSSQKKSQIFLSAPSVAYSGVQGITKCITKTLAHLHSFTDDTSHFALGSHLNGIRRSLGSCQFPFQRNLTDVVPVLRKRKKDEISSNGCVFPTPVPGKIMDKMMLGITEKHLKDNSVIGHSQQEFMRGRSYLT